MSTLDLSASVLSRGRYRRRGALSRERRLTVRFTDEELDAIRLAAASAELTLASYCALATLADAQRYSIETQVSLTGMPASSCSGSYLRRGWRSTGSGPSSTRRSPR
jgi:hypothetical protein